MDGVITHVAAIHRRKIRKIRGTTEKLYDLIEQEEEVYEKTRLNEEKKIKEAELYISRFRSKARLASNVQSRVKALAKLEKKEKLEPSNELRFSFGYAPTPAKTVLTANQLNFSYKPEKQAHRGFQPDRGSQGSGLRDRPQRQGQDHPVAVCWLRT